VLGTIVVEEKEQDYIDFRDAGRILHALHFFVALHFVLLLEVSSKEHHDFGLILVVKTLEILNCV